MLGQDLLAREQELNDVRAQHEQEWSELKNALDRDAELTRKAAEAAAASKINLQQTANDLMLEEKRLQGTREKVKSEALAQLQARTGHQLTWW